MLPGTAGTPSQYRLILQAAAAKGYYAIGLSYPNDRAIEIICGGPGSPDSCSGDARREIITGVDSSAAVAVNASDSIENRLRRLLAWLAASYPTEGWNSFLRGGEPDWTSITIAGHSQGAGHAAYLAKLHEFDWVAMFAGPGDATSTGTPAPWLSLAPATPASRQYGLAHSADELIPLSYLQVNWNRLGIAAFGVATSVDGTAPPYGNTHQLYTSRQPANASAITAPAHSSVVADIVTPLAADLTPLLRPAWEYMTFR